MVNVLAIGFWAVGHLDSVHAKTLFYCFGRLVLRMVSLSIQKIFHLVYSQNGKLYKFFFILLVTRTKDQSCWSQYDRQECLEGRRQMPWMHWRCSCVDTSGIVKLMALKQVERVVATQITAPTWGQAGHRKGGRRMPRPRVVSVSPSCGLPATGWVL